MNRTVGIVGHEAAKFTDVTRLAALSVIRCIFYDNPVATIISGECPLGGIDIWAKEEALRLGRKYIGYPPKVNNWEEGFKPRNLQIAASDEVHNIVVDELPSTYRGRRFERCYHCLKERPPHIKSGGCWTAKRSQRGVWHIIHADGTVDRS